MTQTEQIIQQVRLIVSNHHGSYNGDGGAEAASVKESALKLAGFPSPHNQEAWDNYIEGDQIDDELRKVLIELDDCLDCHNTERYM